MNLDAYTFYVEYNGELIEMKIPDCVYENMMDDAAMEAIIANASPADILQQMLHLCYHRGFVLDEIKNWANRR